MSFRYSLVIQKRVEWDGTKNEWAGKFTYRYQVKNASGDANIKGRLMSLKLSKYLA